MLFYFSLIRCRLIEVDSCCSFCPVLAPCCDVHDDVQLNTNFGSPLPPVDCHVLFMKNEDTKGVIRICLSKKNR